MIDRIRDQLRYRLLGRVPVDRPFVFGIGLSKTGTTSLNDALEILGYRAFHMPPISVVDAGQVRLRPPWWIWKYDALTDLTPAVLFRELDAMFPRARFIHTGRDMEGWLSSCRRHFTPELAAARIDQGNDWMNALCDAVYGSRLYDEDSYRRTYLAHDAAVAAHFEGRPDFLRLDVTAGAGWDRLCGFLGRPVPPQPFPRSNVAGPGSAAG